MVLVGYGRVGEAVAQALEGQQVPFVAVDVMRERVEALRARGIQAVAGDARDPITLVQAHVAHAALMVVAVSDSTDVRPMIDTALKLNPSLQIIARAPNAQEAELLNAEGAHEALHPHGVMARALVERVLGRWSARDQAPSPSTPAPAPH